MAVFKLAFARWVSDGREGELAHHLREALQRVEGRPPPRPPIARRETSRPVARYAGHDDRRFAALPRSSAAPRGCGTRSAGMPIRRLRLRAIEQPATAAAAGCAAAARTGIRGARQPTHDGDGLNRGKRRASSAAPRARSNSSVGMAWLESRKDLCHRPPACAPPGRPQRIDRHHHAARRMETACRRGMTAG